MKRLLLACSGLLFSSVTLAATRAESAQECGIAADMAIVAHSLARESISQPQARSIMNRIYDVTQSERGKAMMQEIIEAAYGKQSQAQANTQAAAGGTAQTGQKFAEELFVTCMKTGGDMDNVLGRKL
jgi:hypothetical protein